jgi:hypothetical protein
MNLNSRIISYGEFGRIWSEAFLFYFKVPFQKMHRQTGGESALYRYSYCRAWGSRKKLVSAVN